jgi:GNAT superfamily N-acetyltransferase
MPVVVRAAPPATPTGPSLVTDLQGVVSRRPARRRNGVASGPTSPDGPTLDRDLGYRLPVRGMMQGGRTYPGIWAQGSGHRQECWLARDDSGRVVGGCLIEFPRQDYDTVVFAYPVVAPDRRHRGIGTALLRHAAGRADGRPTLLTVAVTGSAGSAFATRLGGRPAPYDDVRRVLRVADMHRPAVPDDDYAFVGWDGAIPKAHQATRGTQPYGVAAFAVATGELVALSELSVDPALPGWAFQGMTVVARPHRGHRLGVRVKAALMDRLREVRPDLRAVMTCNAATNTHMIAINEQLGYRPTLSLTTFEFITADLLAADLSTR